MLINKPMIIAINMIDEAEEQGLQFDVDKISELLQTSCVLTSARSGYGIDNMMSIIVEKFKNRSSETNRSLDAFDNIDRVSIVREGIRNAVLTNKASAKFNWTDAFDAVFLHRFFGIPILLCIIFGVFLATFSIGEYPSALIENSGIFLSRFMEKVIPKSLFSMAICDGVIPGVFTVLSFLPRIIIMFFCIAVLEKSGYMARIVFLADGLLRKCGMHGRSAIPLVAGFSCSVPAYMSTRILLSKRSRIATMFAIGMIPCSAKMTFFILLTVALFGSKIAPYVMFFIYILGFCFGILASKIAMFFLSKEDVVHESFAIEMPKYRFPEWQMIKADLYFRSVAFLKNAGVCIAFLSFTMWSLSHVPADFTDYKRYYSVMHMIQGDDISLVVKNNHRDYVLSNSIIGKIGKIVEPVFSPLGFDWRMNISLLAALAAKEITISTLSILYHVSDDIDEERGQMLSTKIHNNISLPSGMAYIVFTMIYLPCVSATAVFAREVRSKKCVIYLISLTTVLAWVCAFFTYRILVCFNVL